MDVNDGLTAFEKKQGAYISRGDLKKGSLRYEFGGLIFGGAYTWRGLFSEFYIMRFWKFLKGYQRL